MTTRLKYGPQGGEVVALIDRLHRLTARDVNTIHDARRWTDPRDEALETAIGAAIRAGRGIALEDADEAVYATVSTAQQRAVLSAGRDVWGDWEGAAACVSDAAIGLIARDLIDSGTYLALTAPVAAAFGPLHPDDATQDADA